MAQPPPPPPSSPNPASQKPGIGDNADITVRFVAKIIDGVIVFILGSIIALVISPLLPRTTGFFPGGGFSFTGFGIATLIIAVVTAVIYLAYLAVLESMRGQTVGKMIMKLQVRGPDGGNPSMEAAIKRNAWVLLSILPWFGNLLQAAAAGYIGYTIYDSQNNVGWHDEFAGGTRVVKIG